MKGVLGEYGMLILVVIVTSIIAIFSFGSQSGGVREQASSIRPRQNLKAGNNMTQLRKVLEKDDPTLEIETQKLKAGNKYEWTQFVTNAADADGRELEVKVNGVTDPDGKERKELETIVKKGMYTVVYQVTDQEGLVTKKQVGFVAD